MISKAVTNGVATAPLLTRSNPAALDVRRIDDERDFGSIKSVWNAIANNASSPSIFAKHEWFTAAWAWRRTDSILHTLVAYQSGTPVCILPLVKGLRTSKSLRQLRLLTVPDTPSCDLIATADAVPRAAEAIADALASSRDWDTLELDPIGCDSALMRFLAPALRRRGLRTHEMQGGDDPFISLTDTWDQYYSTRSRSLKKANNLAANRLKTVGRIRIEWITPEATDKGRMAASLRAAIDISARSWKGQTGNSLDKVGPSEFIHSLSAAAYEQGWLSIFIMHVDDRPVAMEYQLRDGSDIHALRADFDESFARVSPGSYLFRELLQQLFNRGLRRYYMGRGLNLYKDRWTDTSVPLRRLVVHNRTIRGQVTWLRNRVIKSAFVTLRKHFPSAKPPEPDRSAKDTQ